MKCYTRTGSPSDAVQRAGNEWLLREFLINGTERMLHMGEMTLVIGDGEWTASSVIIRVDREVGLMTLITGDSDVLRLHLVREGKLMYLREVSPPLEERHLKPVRDELVSA